MATNLGEAYIDIEKRINKIIDTIKEWDQKQGHDRCWYYPELFEKIAKIVEYPLINKPTLPSREEFEQGCKQYQDQQYRANSITDLVKNVASEEFTNTFLQRLQERRIIKHLTALRMAKGLTQEDITKATSIKVETISTIENGYDRDLTIGFIRDYTKTIGLEVEITLRKQ